MVKVTANLTISFVTVGMAKTTYTPNFCLLGLPDGLKQGPVTLGPGPGPLLHGEAHLDHGDTLKGPLGHGIQVQWQRDRDQRR